MTWRGSTTVRDRFFAGLPYLIPLLESLNFSLFIFMQVPLLQVIFLPLFPLLLIYNFSLGGMQIVPLALFIGLFVGVVRNPDMHHFLRFNTMQALLIAIVLYLCSLLLSLVGFMQPLVPLGFSVSASSLQGIQAPILLIIFFDTVFLGTLVAVAYSIVQCVRGLYAEIPFISEAAYEQTRY
ncbi:hypothetical protein DO97_13780 [Neosynechococcus sphagnicola sy1]|uniref:Uncharacterized protein n=1 Tax=Neosynechococcus sphagnicola sy1 TaxID=1497020 RepID=A0A098TMA7_9CYAN|nr:Tic20 family protein [Neosynechococcus sphagnicola]KGF71973.1 hypothetical protein DO97_13780 [Neosynechococcus sphagnicola sy1]